MSLESFRRALGVRHAEMAACARARALGEHRDEARLDELDADLFSRGAIAEAVTLWRASPAEEAARASRASLRSRLAIVVEEGLLARLRFLDRELESALDRRRIEEASELSAERRRLLSEEGSRGLGPGST